MTLVGYAKDFPPVGDQSCSEDAAQYMKGPDKCVLGVYCAARQGGRTSQTCSYVPLFLVFSSTHLRQFSYTKPPIRRGDGLNDLSFRRGRGKYGDD